MFRGSHGRAGILVPLLVLAFAAPAGAQDVPALDMAVVARAMEPGEVISVYVTCTCATGRPRATAFGADIPLAPLPDGRWHGLAGIDLDTRPGVHLLAVDAPDAGNGTRTHATELAIAAKQFPIRRLRVAAEFVVPPARAIDRIVAEARTVGALLEGVTPRAWSGRSLGRRRAISVFAACSTARSGVRMPGSISAARPERRWRHRPPDASSSPRTCTSPATP
jgi:hypothetical protein